MQTLKTHYFLFTLNFFLFYYFMSFDHGAKNYLHHFNNKNFYLPFQNYIFATSIFFINTLIIHNFAKKIKTKVNFVDLWIPTVLFLIYIFSNFYSKQTYVVFAHNFTKDLIFYIFIFIISVFFFKNSDLFYLKGKEKILFFVFFLTILFISSFLLIDDYHYYIHFSPLNFGAAINSITNSVNNLGANIDFENQYGSYANFLGPLLNVLFNEINLFKVTIILSLIYLISYLIIFYVFFKITNRILFSSLGIFGLIYFKSFKVGHMTTELYFADTVIRFFPAALTIFFIFLNLRSINILKSALFSNLIFTFIFWNTETGIFASLAFIVSFSIILILRKEYLLNLKYLFLIIITLPITYLIIQYYHLIIFQNFVDLNKLFSAVLMYGGNPSVYKINSMFNFSLLLFFILLSNFYFSIRNILNKKKLFLNEFKLSLSILGLGLIAYYVSRFIHLQTSVTCGYISFILLTINLWEFARIKTNKINFKNFFFYKSQKLILIFIWFYFVIGFFSSFATRDLLISYNFIDYFLPEKYRLKRVYGYVSFDQIINKQKSEPEWILKKNFIKNKFFNYKENSSKKIVILSANDYYYNLNLSIKSSIVKTNFHHMYTYCDYKNLFQAVNDKELDHIIVDSHITPILNPTIFKNFLDFLNQSYSKEIVYFDVDTGMPRSEFLPQDKREYLVLFNRKLDEKKEFKFEVSDMRPICDIYGVLKFN